MTCIDRKQSRFRRGLTLMELVVVMVILIALAGVVLPMLPSFLTKAHDTTTTTNISEVNKAMTGYLSTNLSYPNQLDSLVDDTGKIFAGVIFSPSNPNQQNTYTPPGGSTAITPLTLGSLTAGTSSSLVAGGITNLVQLSSSYANYGGPTYGALRRAPPPTLITVGSTTNPTTNTTSYPSVVFADQNYIYGKLYIQPVYDSNNVECQYVVFGLGPYCTMIGSRSFGLFDAPVSFGEHYFEQPTQAYARLLCVFRVYNDGSRCEFVGSAHPDATGLGTFDMHLQEYYQTNNGSTTAPATGS